MTDPQLSLEFDNGEPPRPPAPKLKPRAKPKAVAKSVSAPVAVTPLTVSDMATQVAAHPDYRVLRRLQPVQHFARVAQGPITRVVVLDTETTGLNHATDKIIELALLRVDVDNATGLPVGEVTVYDGLEDPGMPVSAEIQAITGISTEMVRGKTLDVALIATLLSDVDLVIAHNAGFDRPFCEARLPVFAKLAWGCSFVDIDWKLEGQSSAKLASLALSKGSASTASSAWQSTSARWAS